MNRFLFHVVAAAALGGFLFGFDSGVISGCEKAIQAEFGLTAFWHGLIISGALIGTIIGVFSPVESREAPPTSSFPDFSEPP